MHKAQISRQYHERNNYSRSALSYAVQSGHLTTVDLLTKQERQPLWWRDMDGNSVMDYAAGSGRLEMVKYLIQNGCDVAPSLMQRKREYLKSRGKEKAVPI
jgi:ankyrin repeat protein